MKSRIILLILLMSIAFSSLAMSGGRKRVYVRVAPPKPKKVVVVKPKKPHVNAVWVGGHWHWNGHKYVWKKAHWKKPRKGYVWVPGHWKKTPKGWYRVEGHWKRRK